MSSSFRVDGEKSDAAIPVGSELRPPVVEKLIARTLRGNPARARRLALAAIRETFEETGLVIGKPGTPAKTAPASGPWAEFLATGHLPDLAAIHYLGRAITPPNRPKRFDTRFFVVDSGAIRHTVGDVVGPESELIELAWLTLAETIAMPLPTITRIMLAELHGAVSDKTLGTPAPLPFFHERHKQRVRDLIV
jgi:8-oxo-dGTP pyrophosphatase MutT (NUDIX family)